MRAQQLIQKYNDLHGASGVKGQITKNNYYFWKTYLDSDGNLRFEALNGVIYVDNMKIKNLLI